MARKRKGDCYAAAGHLLMDWNSNGTVAKARQEGRDLFLVHGEVFHPKTGWHGHAWIEQDEDLPVHVNLATGYLEKDPIRMRNVYDFANCQQTILPAPVYYYFGFVRNPVYYTPKKALELMTRTGTFGPWDE